MIAFNRPEIDAFGPEWIEEFRFHAAKCRLEELKYRIPALKRMADGMDISRIQDLNDFVPLFIDAEDYKSYDEAWLDDEAYDKMTEWLDQYTTVDLSGVDASSCSSLNEWCALLMKNTGIHIVHSSGTSGVLSFIPRTQGDCIRATDSWLWNYQSFADDATRLFKPGDKKQHHDLFPFLPAGQYG